MLSNRKYSIRFYLYLSLLVIPVLLLFISVINQFIYSNNTSFYTNQFEIAKNKFLTSSSHLLDINKVECISYFPESEFNSSVVIASKFNDTVYSTLNKLQQNYLFYGLKKLPNLINDFRSSALYSDSLLVDVSFLLYKRERLARSILPKLDSLDKLFLGKPFYSKYFFLDQLIESYVNNPCGLKSLIIEKELNDFREVLFIESTSDYKVFAAYYHSLYVDMMSFVALNQKAGDASIAGIMDAYRLENLKMLSQIENIQSLVLYRSNIILKRNFACQFILISIIIIGIILLYRYYSKYFVISVQSVRENLINIESGNYQDVIHLGFEVNEGVDLTLSMASSMQKRIVNIKQLIDGEVDKYKPVVENNSFDEAIAKLCLFYQAKILEAKNHLNDLNASLISHEKMQKFFFLEEELHLPIREFSDLLLKRLIEHTNSIHGAIFTISESDSNYFELFSSYFNGTRKDDSLGFYRGDGLLGTVVTNGELSIVKDLKNDYFNIATSLIQVKPNALVVIPIILKGDVIAVVELACLADVVDGDLKLLSGLKNYISAVFGLLWEYSKQSIAFKKVCGDFEDSTTNIDILKKNVENLVIDNKKFLVEVSQLKFPMLALERSLIMMHLNMNGTIRYVSENFLLIFETEAQNIKGRHFKDFSSLDIESEDYKNMWSGFYKGTQAFTNDVLKLYNGKTMAIKLHFIPVKEEDNEVRKIICLGQMI